MTGSKRILIADKERNVREILAAALRGKSHEVVTVGNGDEAIKMLMEDHFEVAVLGDCTRGKDGLDILNETRDLLSKPKFILMSDSPSIVTVADGMMAGASRFLIKPVAPEELQRAIDEAFDGHGKASPTSGGAHSGEEMLSRISGGEIASMMAEYRVFNPPDELVKKAAVRSMAEYRALYEWSVKDPEGFWGHAADQLDWFQKWEKFREYDFTDKPEVRHFIGGKINVSYNCLDRHLKTARKNKAALIWQGEPDDEYKIYTYQQLHYQVCKFANVLKKMGVKKGEAVCVYLPMIPELAVALLACARIGAVHSVVFGGFSAQALRDRLLDCKAKLLITADGYWRSGKSVKSKEGADGILKDCPDVKDVVVVKRLGVDTAMQAGRDRWWHEEMNAKDITADCPAEVMAADEPLFILYTSGSTGKPKGVLHTQAGYLLHCYQTMKWIFDIKDEDTYWCTADVGWITGHSYLVYGPLAAGATTLMFESVPTYPGPDRFWQIVEKFKVNILYTAPTVIRSLMREGEEWPNKHDLSSLRILGSVGEPINPEAWMWYYRVIGKERCPIVDTWWQTETGGILMSPLPGAIPTKPGSTTVPFPGVESVILRADGTEADVNEGGYLCIKKPWPGMMRTIFGDPARFKDTYFTRFPGYYCTGDGARRDEDGYFWLMGRIDDVMKVSGHRIGTAEVESSLVSHTKVAEAAVVGMPHNIKGESIYAFVTVKTGVKPSAELDKELKNHVRQQIGPIATPEVIQFADGLPKTRSGKIMRRILVKIASGDLGNLGDTSTLADPSVVELLIKGKHP